MPRDDWPREKLMRDRIDEMTIADLLAIVFNTGYRGESVLDMAKRLLKDYGSHALKDQRSVKHVQARLGLPPVKACQLVACFELGRRMFAQPAHGTGSVIVRSPRDVFDHLGHMRSLNKEQLVGLYLNVRNRVIRQETISVGTMTANLVDPKEVFRPAIEHYAHGVILVHNHPSGNPEPSEEDIAITAQLVKSASVLDVRLLDHVIIAENGFVSLNEKGVV